MENNIKITNKELSKRLNYTLEQKIDHSLGVIESFLNQFPESVVSFSGGVDSVVMLFLTRIIDPNRKGVFVNTTNEFTEIIHFVKATENIEIIKPEINFIQVVEKYGFPLISKEVSQYIWEARHTNSEVLRNKRLLQIPNKYIHLLRTKFDICHKCCYHLKKKPFSKINKKGSFVGTKVADSRLRSTMYKRTGCVNNEKKQATPLSIWTNDDIWNFIKKNGIKYCDIYDKGEKTTGCAYCGFGCQFDTTRFARLKEREPKRYKIMMNIKNNEVTYAEAIKFALGININSYTHELFPNAYQEKLKRR